MKKIITAVALLSTLLPFTANAGFFGKEEWEKEDCPKNHSLTWCLADYQGRSKGIRDMSQEEFVAALKKAGVDESRIGDIIGTGLGVGAGLGNLALGNLLGGGVFLLHSLMPDEVDQNRRDAYIVFFDAADSRTDSQVVGDFGTAIRNAVNKSLSVLPTEAKVTAIREDNLQVSMPGHECKGMLSCLIAYSNPRFKVEKKLLPAYIGGQEAVSAGRTWAVGIGMYGLPKGVNAAVLAKTISESLPASYYWFIPAGYLGGNPFPLVLNQGKALFFVKPSSSDTVAVLPHIAAKQKSDEKPVVQTAPASPSASGVAQTSSLAN